MESSSSHPNFEFHNAPTSLYLESNTLSNPSTQTNTTNTKIDNHILEPEDIAKPKYEKIFCSICYLECPSDDSLISCQCQHNFCSDCYREYILTKMNNFEVLNIPCPEQTCSIIVTHENIKSVLNPDQYNRYQELLFKKITYKNLSQKYCPNIKCLKLLALDTIQDFTVCSCGTKICNTCAEGCHPGKPCLDAKDADFALYAKDHDIKFCQICKTAVARVEGCLHITCCVCDYEWCWNCGQQYSHNHECKGEWNPGVPSKETQKQEIQRRKKGCDLTTILTYMIEIPIMILMGILTGIIYAVSWFYIYYSETQKRKGKVLACWESTLIALFSATIGPILLLIVGPCLLAKYIKQRKEIKRQEALAMQVLLHPVNKNSRWLKGNIKEFKYTDHAKPEENQVVIQIPGRQ